MVPSFQFDEFVEEDAFLIDKTLFIKKWMDNGADVAAILRPRRFGKSTNLSMLKSFFSLGAVPSKFSPYLISKESAFVEEHCGKYPVVFLDLKDCRGASWAAMKTRVWWAVRKMFKRHSKEVNSPWFDFSKEFWMEPTENLDFANVS